MKTRILSGSFVTMLLLVGTGCASDGGQTGEETEGSCIETSTALEFDEVSVLGFSPNDVFTQIGVESTAPLGWHPFPALSYGPESGLSSLTLSTPSLRKARYVESKPKSSGPDILLMQCRNRVEIDVNAAVVTPGGALDEGFEPTIRATALDDIRLTYAFAPATLNGQFAITAESLGTRRWIGFTLDARWYKERFRGQITTVLEESSGTGPDSSVSASFYVVACFDDSPTFDSNAECVGTLE